MRLLSAAAVVLLHDVNAPDFLAQWQEADPPLADRRPSLGSHGTCSHETRRSCRHALRTRCCPQS